ncbi:MAG: nucleotide exchange factor GrpE [Microcoleaceae cyanobacterium MO_207.B10]|nr:nucleotide exchange factor GrpE [Microcoleaceae cyanobacterium MO_207.B10]
MAGEIPSAETKNQEISQNVQDVQAAGQNAEAEPSQMLDENIKVSEDNGSIESNIVEPVSQEMFLLKEVNESLQANLEAIKAQLDDITGQYKRLGADFDNFRKRTEKEKEELDVQVKCATIIELLPVIDNFERARSHIKPANDGEMTIHKSYQTVYKQMVDCLKRLGVSPMRPEGEEFDPNLHEAVMREATADHQEGTVTEELMRGYMLGDRVLRHAMVKVATAPEPMDAAEESEGNSEG